jgi:hypothetical protein
MPVEYSIVKDQTSFVAEEAENHPLNLRFRKTTFGFFLCKSAAGAE